MDGSKSGHGELSSWYRIAAAGCASNSYVSYDSRVDISSGPQSTSKSDAPWSSKVDGMESGA